MVRKPKRKKLEEALESLLDQGLITVTNGEAVDADGDPVSGLDVRPDWWDEES